MPYLDGLYVSEQYPWSAAQATSSQEQARTPTPASPRSRFPTLTRCTHVSFLNATAVALHSSDSEADREQTPVERVLLSLRVLHNCTCQWHAGFSQMQHYGTQAVARRLPIQKNCSELRLALAPHKYGPHLRYSGWMSWRPGSSEIRRAFRRPAAWQGSIGLATLLRSPI